MTSGDDDFEIVAAMQEAYSTARAAEVAELKARVAELEAFLREHGLLLLDLPAVHDDALESDGLRLERAKSALAGLLTSLGMINRGRSARPCDHRILGSGDMCACGARRIMGDGREAWSVECTTCAMGVPCIDHLDSRHPGATRG